MGDQQAARARHAVEHAGLVPRPQGAQIDHFEVDARLRKRGGRAHRDVKGARPGHQRRIGTFAGNAGLADRHQVVVTLGHLVFQRPEILVFHVHHRVVTAYGALEQAQVVGRCRRADHHQAGDMGIPGLERLRMLRRRRTPHADRQARDQRHSCLAAEHVAGLGGLVDQFVGRAQRKVGKTHLHHRTRAHHGRPDRGAHDAGLGNRRV